jgi:hypothetical protein
MLGLLVVLAGCGVEKDSSPADPIAAAPARDASCEGLYGSPSATTGLDEDACWPHIDGAGGRWSPPTWNDERLDSLRGWTLLDPPEVPSVDPYVDGGLLPDADKVCAVTDLDSAAGTYRLQTFDGPDDAAASGAEVTHGGACGLCSSLDDLAVYAGISDLTDPVRQCGVDGVLGEFNDTVGCLEELGFTPPCARIWAFNTRHTQESCFDTCIALLSAPYHTADGGLNDCLQCDEDQSGDVFKTVAGRTRRNSGLATALCRPCETVWRVEHHGVAGRGR